MASSRADPKAAKRADTIRQKAGRFRILIVGRANAGKTTILQKVCGTTESPKIGNSQGGIGVMSIDLLLRMASNSICQVDQGPAAEGGAVMNLAKKVFRKATPFQKSRTPDDKGKEVC